MKWLSVKNISFYFNILSQSKLNFRVYLFASVLAGVVIPLSNVLFPRFIVSALLGELSIFGISFSIAVLALVLVYISF